MHNTPSWDQVETFLQVMRAGSLTAAARGLGVAQPTARRRIQALEDTLGTVLFTRTPNGLLATEAADRLVPYAESMEATLRSLVRASTAEADALAGTVRIAASVLLGVEVLPSILRDLRETCPRLDVELLVSNDVADLTHREADLAVRLAPLTGASLVARRVGASALGFFAAPGYLAGRTLPTTLDDLRTHDLLGYDTDPQVIDGLAALGLPLRPRDFVFRTDDDLAYLSALRAGVGIGITHAPLATGLVPVLPALRLPVDVWLVVHQDLRHVRRIRVVLDHLAEHLHRWLERR